MGLIEEEGKDYHPELASYLPGLDTEKMIPMTAVEVNELSDTQREMSATRNSKITPGITGVPTIVDEAPEVVIDEESNNEGETDPLGYEVNVHDIER